MSIASAIQNAQQKVADTYTAISAKGGTLPQTQNLSNMPTAIASIPSGTAPRFGATIANFLGTVNSSGEYIEPTGSTDIVFTGVKSLPSGSFAYKFYYNTSINSVDFPDLESGSSGSFKILNFDSAFMSSTCRKIYFRKLKTTSGYITASMQHLAFQCPLDEIQFPELEEVTAASFFSRAFQGVIIGNTGTLSSVEFPKLKIISGSVCFNYAFSLRTTLQSLSFPALISTGFGSYTNQFNSMLNGVTGCTVHFPSNLQSVIGSWTHVTNGFGGTNTTVLFDLPATT